MKFFVLLSVFLFACYAESSLISINLYGAEENQSLMDSLLSDDCLDRSCDRMCQRTGFKDGACAGNKCVCGEKADDGVLAKTWWNVPRIRSCNIVICNEMCHRLGFAGGRCDGNSCNCY